MDKFGFPTNIKQIGNIDENIRVYIEDTVYAYLMKLSESKEQECIAALIGRCMIIDGKTVLFINGAIQGMYAEMEKGILKFSQLTYEHIEEEKEKYFRGLEVVGWLLSQPNYGNFLSTGYINYHKQNFTKPYQVMFVTDPVERIHTFFNWNENQSDVVEADGFFIYYDRNNDMKAYEEANKIVKSEEINDIELRLLDNGSSYEEDFEEDYEEENETGDGHLTPRENRGVNRAPEPKTIRLTDSETKRVIQTVNKMNNEKGTNKSQDKNKANNKTNNEKYDQLKMTPNQQQKVMNMLVMVSSMLFVVSAIMGVSMMKSDSKINELEEQIVLVTKAYDELVDEFVGDTATVFNPDSSVEVNAAENSTSGTNETEQSINDMLDKQAEVENSLSNEEPVANNVEDGNTESSIESSTANSTKTNTTSNNESEKTYQKYTVGAGDTLSSISMKFYGTKDKQIDIMRLNGIEDPNKIYFGMELMLP